MNNAILLPVCALVLLTYLVWLWMYWLRKAGMAKHKAEMQELADNTKREKILKVAENPSDNFENLFEVPVLFFVAAIIIHVNGLTDTSYVVQAWVFVALRAAHSLIHCTYNRILHRFVAYATGTILLGAIWIRLALQLLG